MIRKFEAFKFTKSPKELSEKELNRKKLKGLPKFIMDNYDGVKISDCLLTKVQVGRSSKNPGRLIVELTDVRNNSTIRIGFLMNKNFKIISPDTFYLAKNGKLVIHSIKHHNSLAHKIDIKQIQLVQDKIMDYFRS